MNNHLTKAILNTIATRTPYSLEKIEAEYERLGSIDHLLKALEMTAESGWPLGFVVGLLQNGLGRFQVRH